MKHLICLYLLSIVLTSCLEVKKKEYVNQLEQLLLDVDSMVLISKKIDVKAVDSLSQIRCSLLDAYKSGIQPDTISVETAQHIENIKFSCFNLRQFNQNKKTLETTLKKQRELKSLLKMIHEGNGDRSSYQELVKEEIRSVSNLKTNFSRLAQNYADGIRNFETSERYLNELLSP